METLQLLVGVSQRPLQYPDMWVELAKGVWLVERGGSAEKVGEVMVSHVQTVNGALPVKRLVLGVVEMKQVEAGWQVEREEVWSARDLLGPEQRKHQMKQA